MGGFGYQIHQMITDTQGDAQIRSSGFIPDPAPIAAAVGRVPGVVATTPFAQGIVLLERGSTPAFPTIQGVDVDTVGKVIPLDRYIRLGSIEDLDDDSIILSAQLAVSIGARVGSKVDVYSPLQIEKAKNDELMLARELTVSGIFEIGHQQLDSSTVIVTLRLMQDLYGLGHAVHGINVRLAPDVDADEAAVRINQALAKGQGTQWPALPGLLARSWREIDQEFLWVLQLEKNIMTVILLFVVLVAAFLTYEPAPRPRDQEDARDRALERPGRDAAAGRDLLLPPGGRDRHRRDPPAGSALGFTFLHFRNDVVRLVTRFTGSRALLERFYQFSQLPSHTDPRDITIIVLSSLVLSTLAGAIPAIMAARLKPVEALRNE